MLAAAHTHGGNGARSTNNELALFFHTKNNSPIFIYSHAELIYSTNRATKDQQGLLHTVTVIYSTTIIYTHDMSLF